MTLKEEILHDINDVPESSLQTLLQFVRFLISNSEASGKESKKPYRSGKWIQGEILMSDDFDDPMEFVSESEMRILEAMRDEKIQEAAV